MPPNSLPRIIKKTPHQKAEENRGDHEKEG